MFFELTRGSKQMFLLFLCLAYIHGQSLTADEIKLAGLRRLDEICTFAFSMVVDHCYLQLAGCAWHCFHGLQ